MKLKKSDFHKEIIFIPTLWSDIMNRNEVWFSFENKLASQLLPLPIDHRYGKED